VGEKGKARRGGQGAWGKRAWDDGGKRWKAKGRRGWGKKEREDLGALNMKIVLGERRLHRKSPNEHKKNLTRTAGVTLFFSPQLRTGFWDDILCR
jgi:hypothetical protein